MPSNTDALKIDLADLANALEDHSGLAWYLDTESGEVVPVSEDADDDVLPVPRDEFEESDRFVFVEPIESREGWEDMRDFAATVTDRRLRELLEVALAGKGAFPRFRDVLAGHPEERACWFAEHDRRMQDRAQEWLEAHEIAWRPSRESAPAPRESTERGSDKANRQPISRDPARSAGSRERCEMCARRDLDQLWIEVTPEGEGISRVTVDVTLRLCPDHRRRLIEALGRQDGEEIERPRYDWE